MVALAAPGFERGEATGRLDRTVLLVGIATMADLTVLAVLALLVLRV